MKLSPKVQIAKPFKKLLLPIFFLLSCTVGAQIDSLSQPYIHAQFPGGPKEMVKFIMSNVDCYVSPSDNGTPLGKLIVEYYIDERGNTTDVKIIKSSNNQQFDKQVIATIYAMPRWEPAETKEGKKIKQLMRLPMNICMR